VVGKRCQNRINEFGGDSREMRAGNSVQLENTKGDHGDPAPVFAPFKIAKKPQDVHRYYCDSVVGKCVL